LTFGRKRSHGAKPRRRIVVKEAAVQLVCTRLGDKSHLSDRADIGAVVSHIDAHLFETFDELNQRSDLCSVLASADADAVDRLIRLVSAAPGKSPERLTSAGCDDSRRQCKKVIELPGVQR